MNFFCIGTKNSETLIFSESNVRDAAVAIGICNAEACGVSKTKIVRHEPKGARWFEPTDEIPETFQPG